MSTCPTVLVVEDDLATRTHMADRLRRYGCEVLEAATLPAALEVVDTRVFDLVFLDLGLGRDDPNGERGRALFGHLQTVVPEVPVVVVTADNRAPSAVELLKQGAYHYAVKPIKDAELEHLAHIGTELSATRRALGVLRDVQGRTAKTAWHVGQTARMHAIEQMVNRFAPTDVGILIQGESGTGKDVVARVIHERSGRRGAIVSLNCAAIPRDLMESQLFGHEKGAFTGAHDLQRGLLELADGGTLFLDELTSMAPELQAKLLRAMQEFTFRRVGGQREHKVQVRVISATNQDVGEAIRDGRFRSDLYYRLCVMAIELPPLRDRSVDIPHFVDVFVGDLSARAEAAGLPAGITGVTDAAMWALTHCPWRGNIRELRNVVERAFVLATGEERIDAVHLPPYVRGMEPGAGVAGNGHAASLGLPVVLPAEGIDLKGARDTWERACVVQALERTNGNQTAAARLLGLTRDELRYRVDKFGLTDDDAAPQG